ncbi:hypothetical protein [Pseudoalteromonas marina]|uniref:Uncharacterized protein n=1 Tax=Pseudoalteromonas marina TaxID=267375 RepID=A0ABT9FGF2_9GAMM|nr:hypothetical protein [Pseudoalteromonas marina]MDP2565861.1 hypothetical protein [Pseudoalteromonas marina]
MYFVNTNGNAISVVKTCLQSEDIFNLFEGLLDQGISIAIDIDDLLSKLKLRNNNLNNSVVYIDKEFKTVSKPEITKVIISKEKGERKISLVVGSENESNTLYHADDKNSLMVACATDMEALFKVNQIIDSKVKKLMTGWYFGKLRTGHEAINALDGKEFELLCGNKAKLVNGEFIVEDGSDLIKDNCLIQRLGFGYKRMLKQGSTITWPDYSKDVKTLLDSISKSKDSEYEELNQIEKIELLLSNFYLSEKDWEKRIVANICIYEILTM